MVSWWHTTLHCVSEKKNDILVILVISWSDVIQFSQFLAETYPPNIWNEHKCTATHILFRISYGTANEQRFLQHTVGQQRQIRSRHKSQIVASDNYQVTFILSERAWSLVHQFSHRRTAVHDTWSIASPMTRWCRPDQIMQHSGAARQSSHFDRKFI